MMTKVLPQLFLLLSMKCKLLPHFTDVTFNVALSVLSQAGEGEHSVKTLRLSPNASRIALFRDEPSIIDCLREWLKERMHLVSENCLLRGGV